MVSPSFSAEHDLAAIARSIREIFPTAGRVAPLRIIGEGFSSLAVDTAGGVVFRIARTAEAGKRYAVEYGVLPLLQPHLPVAIPQPGWYCGETGAFPFGIIGYPKLPGELLDLNFARFHTQALASQIAAILVAFREIQLAELPAGTLLPADFSTRHAGWQAQQASVLPALHDALSVDEYARVAAWWEDFLQDEQMGSYIPVVQHGDLWFGNILTGGERIVGLLDFENLAIGDPALDFVPQLYLGEPFLRHVISAYEQTAGQLDAGFEHRLRQLWALREFDGLAWAIQNDDRAEFADAIEKIRHGPIFSARGLDGWSMASGA